MSNQTFKEKYIDLKYDWDLAFELSAEFICTIIFVLGIFTFPLYQWGSAITGFAVFMIASFVINTFGRRCGALFNPAIATGLMFAGKLNIVKGTHHLLCD